MFFERHEWSLGLPIHIKYLFIFIYIDKYTMYVEYCWLVYPMGINIFPISYPLFRIPYPLVLLLLVYMYIYIHIFIYVYIMPIAYCTWWEPRNAGAGGRRGCSARLKYSPPGGNTSTERCRPPPQGPRLHRGCTYKNRRYRQNRHRYAKIKAE